MSSRSRCPNYEKVRSYCQPCKEAKRLLYRPKFKESIDMGSEGIPPLFMGIYNLSYSAVETEIFRLSTDEINALNYAGQFPLHASCQVKSIGILKSLIHRGAKVNIMNTLGNTPLHSAVLESWQEGVVELLRNGADPNAITQEKPTVKLSEHHTPLQMAAKLGNENIFRLLLDYNPNLLTKDSQGNTLFHLAAHSHSLEILQILLTREECFDELTVVNENGSTPLHLLMTAEILNETSEQEILKCLQLLIKEGLEVNSKNMLGETPLYLACENNFPLVVEYLLKIKADPKILTITGKSTLHACCRAGSEKCLRQILHSKAVCDLVLKNDDEGHSPFHNAIAGSSNGCCELLLSNGDNLANRDSKGRTRCSLIILNLPHAYELLNRIFDMSIIISNTPIHDPSFNVLFDHSTIFNRNIRCVQNSIISDLTVPRYEKLLKHPLIESFLYIKWGRIKPFFYLGVFNYFVFLLIHTVFVLKTYGGAHFIDWSLPENQKQLVAFRVLYILMILIITIPDVVLILAQFKKSLLQMETYTKLITFSTAIFIIWTPLKDYNDLFQRNIASISILIGWFELMLLMGRFPTFGVYIQMFIKISKSIFKFLIAFSSVLIGYACAFEILFYDVETFKTLPLTLLRTIMMMVGEIDYGDIYNEGNFTILFREKDNYHEYEYDFTRFIVLTSFVFLVPVLMANLLIGLAVNDLPDLRRQGKMKRLSMQASYINSYVRLVLFLKNHSIFPDFIRKLLSNQYNICNEVRYYPNKNIYAAKQHLKMPTETLQEAIIIGSKEENVKDICSLRDDLETQFYSFRSQYNKDWRNIENRLSKLSMNNSKNEKYIIEILNNIQKELHDQRTLINKFDKTKV